MAMHLRADQYFVEDEPWHEAADRYVEFLEANKGKKLVLIELGVGFNTPVIIRFPFEKMAFFNHIAIGTCIIYSLQIGVQYIA